MQVILGCAALVEEQPWVVTEPLRMEHQKAMTLLAATANSMSSWMSSQSRAQLILAHRSCRDG